LVLRSITEDDAGHLFALDSNRDVMRYLTGDQPTPCNVVEHQILPLFTHYDPDHPASASGPPRPGLAFIKQATAFPAGSASGPYTRPIHANCPRFQAPPGGLAPRLCHKVSRTLIHLGFTELGVERVVATTYQANLAFRRVLEEASLSLARRFRWTPADIDAVDIHHAAAGQLLDGGDLEYALEKATWEA
jgi:hypothetical protein